MPVPRTRPLLAVPVWWYRMLSSAHLRHSSLMGHLAQMRVAAGLCSESMRLVPSCLGRPDADRFQK